MLQINDMWVSVSKQPPIWIGRTFERFDYSIIVCLYVSTMDRCVPKKITSSPSSFISYDDNKIENRVLTPWHCVRVCEMWNVNTMLAFPLLLLLHHKSTVKLPLSYFVVFFSISSDIFSDYVHHVPAATTPLHSANHPSHPPITPFPFEISFHFSPFMTHSIDVIKFFTCSLS